ncbi:MAG TPA: hypothetical protein VI756_19600 [Blastocatellia bacterium]
MAARHSEPGGGKRLAGDSRNRPKKSNETSSSRLEYVHIVQWFFVPLGILGLLMVCLHRDSAVGITNLVLWALALFVAGGAVGFIFGIPKVVQGLKDDETRPSGDATHSDGRSEAQKAEAFGYRQFVNTSLGEISDWLTKIIVGLGLVKLQSVPHYLAALAAVLVGGGRSSGLAFSFASAEITYFTIFGFLFGYLSTRLFLSGAFSREDRSQSLLGASGAAQLRTQIKVYGEGQAPASEDEEEDEGSDAEEREALGEQLARLGKKSAGGNDPK